MPWPDPISREGLSPLTIETLDLYQLLHSAMEKFGPNCLGSNVISLTSFPSDMLTVLWLWALGSSHQSPARNRRSNLEGPTPIAPLFEKIGDLKRGPATLESILKQPVYAQHLTQHGMRQMVMMWYSDSTKDGGYLAACWGLYRAQSDLQRVADRFGVHLTFFHGRGAR